MNILRRHIEDEDVMLTHYEQKRFRSKMNHMVSLRHLCHEIRIHHMAKVVLDHHRRGGHEIVSYSHVYIKGKKSNRYSKYWYAKLGLVGSGLTKNPLCFARSQYKFINAKNTNTHHLVVSREI